MNHVYSHQVHLVINRHAGSERWLTVLNRSDESLRSRITNQGAAVEYQRLVRIDTLMFVIESDYMS